MSGKNLKNQNKYQQILGYGAFRGDTKTAFFSRKAHLNKIGHFKTFKNETLILQNGYC
jgi:hypothetical protein